MFRVPKPPNPSINKGKIHAFGYTNEKNEKIIHLQVVFKRDTRSEKWKINVSFEFSPTAIRKLDEDEKLLIDTEEKRKSLVTIFSEQKLDEPRVNSYICPCHPNYPIDSDCHDPIQCYVHLIAGKVMNAVIVGKSVESVAS